MQQHHRQDKWNSTQYILFLWLNSSSIVRNEFGLNKIPFWERWFESHLDHTKNTENVHKKISNGRKFFKLCILTEAKFCFYRDSLHHRVGSIVMDGREKNRKMSDIFNFNDSQNELCFDQNEFHKVSSIESSRNAKFHRNSRESVFLEQLFGRRILAQLSAF